MIPWEEEFVYQTDTAPRQRMSDEHLQEWRDNIVDRVQMMMIEPGTLVALIDEVLVSRVKLEEKNAPVP